MASKAIVAPVATSASVRSSMNVGAVVSHDVLGAEAAQQLRLLGAAHDVHQRDPSCEADLVQHLTQVRGRRRVHERGVAFEPHGLDHAERGQRVDEAGRALAPAWCRRAARGIGGLDRRGTARTSRRRGCRPRLAEQRLRCRREPAATTTPAPSLPTGIDWSRRPAMARISAREWSPVTPSVAGAGRWPCHVRRAEQEAQSDGLIGEASTRTTTSSARVGRRPSGSESSSSPLAFTSERSCRPSFAISASPLFVAIAHGLQHGRRPGVQDSIQPRYPPVLDGHDQARAELPACLSGRTASTTCCWK